MLHLVRRFFYVLRARPLRPREQAEVAALLNDGERDLFWEQPVADMRHALVSARHVLRIVPGRRDLARAALLHDVGKRHAGLGVIGRSVASAGAIVGFVPGKRLGAYLDHGELGAADLAAAGAEQLVVDFTRHHHGARPGSIGADEWDLLQAADHT